MLRPHCLAKDRLILWKPLTAHSSLTNSSSLLASDIQQIYNVILHAWADSTKESYSASVLIFHVFCDSKDVPESQRAPANSTLIAAFISTLTGLYSGNTILNYLHRVRAWHIIHGQKWALVDEEINALLKAATSLAPPSSKRPAREPYTINIIILIRAQLNLESPLHAAIFTCLTTMFFATARITTHAMPTSPSCKIAKALKYIISTFLTQNLPHLARMSIGPNNMAHWTHTPPSKAISESMTLLQTAHCSHIVTTKAIDHSPRILNSSILGGQRGWNQALAGARHPHQFYTRVSTRVAKVQFSSVQWPLGPNLNLNLVPTA
ncbi:hypothetical protein BDN67DRAFT_983525 [Paxillus ammoniavirescens]|nr:hypothetical protein BDN67DRAFT_983525 [Paxillus ammoniavirescens]